MAARDDSSTILVVSHWAFILALSGASVANGEMIEYDPTLQCVENRPAIQGE
jgi:hypothetical protein